MKYLGFYFLVWMCWSCQADEVLDSSGFEKKILGIWINPIYNGNIMVLEKSSRLEENYGVVFKSTGYFLERKNAGWCGTPPITYSNFVGTWTQQGDLLEITIGYWGGMVNHHWKIIEVTNSTLSLEWL